MTYTYQIILTFIIVSALLRYLPFIMFSKTKELPSSIIRLGKTLPLAAMGMLVIYCLKDVDFVNAYYGIPEIVSICLVAILYKKSNSNLISIFIPTLFYLILVNLILV